MFCIFHCNFVKVVQKLTEREREKEDFKGNVEWRAEGRKEGNEMLSREESSSQLQCVRTT